MPSGASASARPGPCVKGLVCLADRVLASEVLVRSRAANFSALAGSCASAHVPGGRASEAFGRSRTAGSPEPNLCPIVLQIGSRWVRSSRIARRRRGGIGPMRAPGQPMSGEALLRGGQRPRRSLRRFSGPILPGPVSRETAGAPRRKNTPPLSRTRALNRAHEASGCALSQGTAQKASALCTRRLFYCAIRRERQLNFVVPVQIIARSRKIYCRRGNRTL